MLISYSEFIDSGMPVSTDISQIEVEAAIQAVTNFYIKPLIGDENLLDLLSNPTDETNKILLKGGVLDGKLYTGLQAAMYHLVFAYMMMDSLRITRYSSVEKDSEYSKSVSRKDLYNQGRVHWDIGDAFVKEVMNHYGLAITGNCNMNPFEVMFW